MLRRITSKIQNKLIILFSIFCLTIFSVSGVLHYWYTESSLDEELGKKLLAVAQAASLQINNDLVARLKPGDEKSRTYRNSKKKLIELRNATEVERIYIIDSTGSSLLDTEEGVSVGYPYPFLKFNQYEFDRSMKGLPSHSILFETFDGKLYKTAFVPFIANNEIAGAIAVDGSATFLYLIKRIQWHLITVGFIGVIVSIILGYFFSRTISNPVKHLMDEAEKIGAGKLEGSIVIQSRDEIGFLGRTMEKMRQNILKRDQYLKTMLAGVAHELRNPLGGVEIFAHLLNKEIPDSDNKHTYSKKIVREVDVMKKILTDFLEFARPNDPIPEMCNIQKLVDEIHTIFDTSIREKRIQFHVHVSDKKVYADPGHLRQILMNLIENAIHSVAESGIIKLDSRPIENGIELSIEDNGHGIEASIREKIFDPFFTTKEKGSGLGLAIVKKLVDENNGDITLGSEQANGTRFILTLPGAPREIIVKENKG
jgi:signal transduction histidine kinase